MELSLITEQFKRATYILAGVVFFSSMVHLSILFALICINYHRNPKDLKKLFFPIVKNVASYLQVMVFILALLYSLLILADTATTGCCEEVTWHFGLFAIVLGWTHLIHLCSKLPFIGEHAIVFLDIAWTFLKLTAFALMLVLAATIVLAMTFFNAQALVS